MPIARSVEDKPIQTGWKQEDVLIPNIIEGFEAKILSLILWFKKNNICGSNLDKREEIEETELLVRGLS